MLSHKILKCHDIKGVTAYYEDSKDDFYNKNGRTSEWQGKGAETLGLQGLVNKEKFKQLLTGEIEGNKNTRSSTRLDNSSHIAIDFTFSAPKSVSLQALIGKDERVIKAHDRAVERAVKIAESNAEARKKINNESEIEHTNNLIVAKFRHETSREQDPQLHTHAVIMNLTQRSDGQWRALRNDEIIQMTKYLGAVYRAELATELQNIGYKIRNEDKGLFELAHISRQQIIEFSKRSRQVEQELAKQGLSRELASTDQKQQATLISRKPKIAEKREIIFENWLKQAQDLNIDFDLYKRRKDNNQLLREKEAETKENVITPDQLVKIEAAKRALNFAANYLTRHNSYMDERTLINTAVKQAAGTTNFLYIENELNNQVKQGSLIRADSLYVPANQINTQQGKTKQEWINEFASSGMNPLKANNYFKEAIRNGDLIKLEPQYTTSALLAREKQVSRVEKVLELDKAQIKQNENSKELLGTPKTLELDKKQNRLVKLSREIEKEY